jgi:hypothetical protein
LSFNHQPKIKKAISLLLFLNEEIERGVKKLREVKKKSKAKITQ